LNRAFSKGSAAKLLRPRIPFALNSAHFMLTRLFSKGSATLRPTLYAGSQTGAFYPQDKSDLRDARTYFRMNRQKF
jgi:hypothetical protein